MPLQRHQTTSIALVAFPVPLTAADASQGGSHEGLGTAYHTFRLGHPKLLFLLLPTCDRNLQFIHKLCREITLQQCTRGGMDFAPNARAAPLVVHHRQLRVSVGSVQCAAESHPFDAPPHHGHNFMRPCFQFSVKDPLHVTLRCASTHIPVCHLTQAADAFVLLQPIKASNSFVNSHDQQLHVSRGILTTDSWALAYPVPGAVDVVRGIIDWRQPQTLLHARDCRDS